MLVMGKRSETTLKEFQDVLQTQMAKLRQDVEESMNKQLEKMWQETEERLQKGLNDVWHVVEIESAKVRRLEERMNQSDKKIFKLELAVEQLLDTVCTLQGKPPLMPSFDGLANSIHDGSIDVPKPDAPDEFAYSPLTQQRSSKLWLEFSENIAVPASPSVQHSDHKDFTTSPRNSDKGKQSVPNPDLSPSVSPEAPSSSHLQSPFYPNSELFPNQIVIVENPHPSSSTSLSPITTFRAMPSVSAISVNSPTVDSKSEGCEAVEDAVPVVPPIASSSAHNPASTALDPQVVIVAQNFAAACVPLFQQALQQLLDSRPPCPSCALD